MQHYEARELARLVVRAMEESEELYARKFEELERRSMSVSIMSSLPRAVSEDCMLSVGDEEEDHRGARYPGGAQAGVHLGRELDEGT